MLAGVLEQRIEILALQETEKFSAFWEVGPDFGSFMLVSPTDTKGVELWLLTGWPAALFNSMWSRSSL